MKRIYSKGIIYLLVLITLVTLSLFGCAPAGDTTGTPQASSQPDKSPPAASAQPGSSPAGTAEDGPPKWELPITNEPITFDMFIGLDSKAALTISNLSEQLALQHLEEMTGIHVSYNHPSSATTGAEALNMMFASNELADIMYGVRSVVGGLDSVVESGQILRLNELINEHAYYLYNVFEEYPDFKVQVMTYEGNIAVMPTSRLAEVTRFFESFIIRKDWLDKLGLEIPTDIDSWYEVLTAFKNDDPNGNGLADELPFISNSNEEMGVLRLGCFHGLNSTWYKWNGTTIKDGKVSFGAFDPEFLDYLTTMNKWYVEGLIDPEYLSTDAQGFSSKVLNDLGGLFYGKMNGGIGTFMGATTNPEFEVVPIPYPTSTDGQSYNFYYEEQYDGGGAAISSSCKYPVEAIKWLDYWYSPEGQLLGSFGIEDLTYTFDADGVPHYTELITKNPDGLSVVNAIARYAPAGFSPRLVNDAYYFNEITLYEQQKLMYPAASSANLDIKMKNLKYSIEEDQRLVSLLADLGTYYKENVHAFIMGAKPLSEFDSFIATLKSMKMEEVLNIQQSALDYYNTLYD